MDENEAHTCSGFFDGNHPQVPARFLAQKFIDKLHDQPSYRPSDMRKDVEYDLLIDISYVQTNMASKRACQRNYQWNRSRIISIASSLLSTNQ